MVQIKNRFLMSFIIVAFSFVLTHTAHASACIATTGDWDAPGTWSDCAGGIPLASDTVTIPTNVTVTIDEAGAVAASVSISDPVAASNGITLSGAGALTVTGAVTFVGSSGAGNSTVAVADGDVTAGSISIVDGAGTGDSLVSVGTDGTITTTGSGIAFTVTHIADTQLTSIGSGLITIGGTTGSLGSGGTFTRGTSTVTFSGSGAQNVGAYSYYNVTINKSAGTATLLGNSLILGNLIVSSGIFDSSTHSLDTTLLTTISSGAVLTHGTGAKVHNSDVLIHPGATFLEAGAATITFYGHVTNNGTFTASTGVHTFAQDDRTINGTLSIPNVTLTGHYTNNGTLTVSTALSGTHTLINNTTGVLNIGGTSAITGLNATIVGNVVNYTGTAQTVKAVTYYNLSLQGSGLKTIGSGIAIANELSVDEGVSVALTGASTADSLLVEGFLQHIGSWGSTASVPDHIDDTYFSGTGTVTTTTGTSYSTNRGSGSHKRSLISSIPTVTPINNYAGCTVGALFSTTTGMTCTGMPHVVPSVIAGCDGRTTGFSTTTGVSCVGNVSVEVVKPNVNTSGVTMIKNDLSLGMAGENVTTLQLFLIAQNKGLKAQALASVGATSVFGPMTQEALAEWQESAGISPASGYFGPKSRVQIVTMGM